MKQRKKTTLTKIRHWADAPNIGVDLRKLPPASPLSARQKRALTTLIQTIPCVSQSENLKFYEGKLKRCLDALKDVAKDNNAFFFADMAVGIDTYLKTVEKIGKEIVENAKRGLQACLDTDVVRTVKFK